MRQKQLTKRQQQGVETRQTLLATSLELFVRKSFAGTTIRDIAKASRVSPGLMFHYFPSKDAILQAQVKLMAAGIDSVVDRLRSSTEPLETFRAIARSTLESLSDEYSKNLFLLANQVLSLDSIPSAAKKIVSRTKSLDASASLIALGQRKGEIKKGDPYALAIAFWGAIQGIAEILVWNRDAPIPDADDVIRMLER